MKNWLVVGAVALGALAAAPSEAVVINPLHLEFQSGATFDGTVTFNDGYAGMIDTNGTLTGGPYGSIGFSWTWWAGTGQTNPQDYDGDPATYEDILMGGAAEPSYTNFIGLSWGYPVLGSAPILNLSPNDGPYPNYWRSADAGADLIVAGSFGDPVPEPGTLLLLGSGLSALVLRRRRAA